MRHVIPFAVDGRLSINIGDDDDDDDDGENVGRVGPEAGTYVQGMNVIAAPFLYVARSEAEAFVAFIRFLSQECPGYVRGAMEGVHKGLAVRVKF